MATLDITRSARAFTMTHPNEVGFEAALTTQPDLWPWLDHLKGKPVAILRGALSDLFTEATADRMVRELGPDAELVTVPNVGHAPSFDEPESIAAVERLLARVKG